MRLRHPKSGRRPVQVGWSWRETRRLPVALDDWRGGKGREVGGMLVEQRLACEKARINRDEVIPSS